MRKWISCMGALLLTLSALGQYGGVVRLDRHSGKYKVGDTITCKVKLTKDDKALNGTRARMTLKFEGKTLNTQDFTTNGRLVEFSYTADKPGWVSFGFEVLGEDGTPLKGKGVFRHSEKPSIVTEIGSEPAFKFGR